MGWSRQARTRRGLRVAASAVLLFTVVEIGSRAGTALVVREPVSHPDAIISLASHEQERLPVAARLAAAHPDATLLLTLPSEVTEHNCDDCAHRVETLQRLGIDARRVRVLPLSGPGTHGEAVAALSFAQSGGVKHLVIATSPYHTRRSLALFRKVFEGTGVQIGIEPAIDTSPAQPARWWLSSYDRRYVAYEWAAIVYYAIRYGVPVTVG